MTKHRKGFTLIELLVVVLIIGVLSAIALPMYQKAVLKSRFAALMPIVKSMNDSNEAYYLEHGQYASNPQDLPVQGQSEYPTGTQLEFGHNMDYAYVLAYHPTARNNYIMYQKHSENYPGEIHCEARNDDENAKALCASYGSNNIGTTLTNGYTTYVIQGVGFGLPAPATEANCRTADMMGLSCNITTNEEGQTVKQMCFGEGADRICRTKTYNEDGSYTSITCKINGSNGENVCTANWHSVTYDANGNMTSRRSCSTVASDGTCNVYSSYDNYDYTYDANGNKTSERKCSTVASDGTCSAYSETEYYYYYDDGKQIASQYCTGSKLNTTTGECIAYNNTSVFAN